MSRVTRAFTCFRLEVFLSSPEFTGALQDFVSANDSIYVSVDKGKEQPLRYLKSNGSQHFSAAARITKVTRIE